MFNRRGWGLVGRVRVARLPFVRWALGTFVRDPKAQRDGRCGCWTLDAQAMHGPLFGMHVWCSTRAPQDRAVVRGKTKTAGGRTAYAVQQCTS